jgi:hypothetical protein
MVREANEVADDRKECLICRGGDVCEEEKLRRRHAMSIDIDSFIKDAKERGLTIEQIADKVRANKQLERQVVRRMSAWKPGANEPPCLVLTDEERLSGR